MEEEKEELGSVRKTCPHCHGRSRVKPSKTTCPSCGGSFYRGPEQEKAKKEKKIKVKKEKPALIPKPTKEKLSSVKPEEKSTSKPESTDTFYIKSKRGADASGEIVMDGMVRVHNGSMCASDWVTSTQESTKAKGKQLRDEGVIVDNKFARDHTFSSPSMAAAIVMGRSANGLKEWRNADGKTLKELKDTK